MHLPSFSREQSNICGKKPQILHHQGNRLIYGNNANMIMYRDYYFVVCMVGIPMILLNKVLKKITC